MFNDPIVLETRKHREEYAASFGYDLDQIVADLPSRQGRDGRLVVDRMTSQKTVQAPQETSPAPAGNGNSIPGSP